MNTVSEYPSRGTTNASGPALLSIRLLEDVGGSTTTFALATSTTDRSRMNCIRGCDALTSRIVGPSTSFVFS